MDLGTSVALLRTGLIQILVIAGPILAVGMGIGLIIAIFQATTSIQDQTISIVPKIAAIMLTIFLLAPWFANVFMNYVVGLFQQISTVVR